MVILDLERSRWRLDIHVKMQKSRHILPSFDGARRVRLLRYCGHAMNTDLLRKSFLVDVC